MVSMKNHIPLKQKLFPQAYAYLNALCCTFRPKDSGIDLLISIFQHKTCAKLYKKYVFVKRFLFFQRIFDVMTNVGKRFLQYRSKKTPLCAEAEEGCLRGSHSSRREVRESQERSGNLHVQFSGPLARR